MTASFDYLDSASWEEGKILERTRWLRAHDPVHWSEANQLWVLTRFAEVSYVSKHHKLFCSGQGVRPGNARLAGRKSFNFSGFSRGASYVLVARETGGNVYTSGPFQVFPGTVAEWRTSSAVVRLGGGLN